MALAKLRIFAPTINSQTFFYIIQRKFNWQKENVGNRFPMPSLLFKYKINQAPEVFFSIYFFEVS
jgi:hypothetical protein